MRPSLHRNALSLLIPRALLALLALTPSCGGSDRGAGQAREEASAVLRDLLRDAPRGGLIAGDAAVLLIRSSTPEEATQVAGMLEALPEPFSIRPVQELGRARVDDAAEVLSGLFDRSKNVLHKVEVALALVQLGREAKADWLIRTLESDPGSYNRARAAAALGEASVKRSRTALLKALRESSDPFVQASAANALGRVADVSAPEALYQAIQNTQRMSVALAAVEALERMGGGSSAAQLESTVKQQTLSEHVRRRALEALDRIGRREVGQFLKRQASGDHRLKTKVFAVEGLGILRDTTGTALLRSALGSDRGSPLRLAAAWSLARMGEVSDLGRLVVDDLEHPTPGYQTKAAEVLGMLRDDRWTAALGRKLQADLNPAVRAAIVKALAGIGSRDAVEFLEGAYRASGQIDAKTEIVAAIGRSDADASGPVLARILTDSEYLQIRLVAIEGLGATDDVSFLPHLRPLLSADAPEIRFQAAAAILRLTRGVWLDTVDSL